MHSVESGGIVLILVVPVKLMVVLGVIAAVLVNVASGRAIVGRSDGRWGYVRSTAVLVMGVAVFQTG